VFIRYGTKSINVCFSSEQPVVNGVTCGSVWLATRAANEQATRSISVFRIFVITRRHHEIPAHKRECGGMAEVHRLMSLQARIVAGDALVQVAAHGRRRRGGSV